MRIAVVTLVIAVGLAPGCRRVKPGMRVERLPGGATFEVPDTARPLATEGPDELSFAIGGGARLDVAREPMGEDCQTRLAWIEEQTQSEIESGRVAGEAPIERMTLGARQSIRAALVTVPSATNATPLVHTEMIGMCGEKEFVIFQVAYREDPDPSFSRVLTDAAVSLRY